MKGETRRYMVGKLDERVQWGPSVGERNECKPPWKLTRDDGAYRASRCLRKQESRPAAAAAPGHAERANKRTWEETDEASAAMGRSWTRQGKGKGRR